MGIIISKCYKEHQDSMQLNARIQVLKEEIEKLILLRKHQEDDWRTERRKHKEECAKLRRRVNEDDERIRSLEGELLASRENECKEWQHWLGTECLVEHMKEEQAQREVAIEKWKHLYLTIKNELDDLIVRTKQGGRSEMGVEGMIDKLQMELMAKEETIKVLESRVVFMEREGATREREMDILRQSLRILGSRRNGTRRNKQRRWLS